MTTIEKQRLFKLAHAIRTVAGHAKFLARGKGYYGKEDWGDGYQREFDDFEHALAELEQLRNPEGFPPNLPDRLSPKPLLPAQSSPELEAEVVAILGFHDAIMKARGVEDVCLVIHRGVFAEGPGLVRTLRIGKTILEESEQAATNLEGLLANWPEDSQTTSSNEKAVLSVDRWSDLGIGIKEDGHWAICPCPPTGEVVDLRKAIKLPLVGERWKKVLECFAESEDGKTAKKTELMTVLRYVQVGNISAEQAHHDEHLRTQLGHASRTLSSTMADLKRELSALVETQDQAPVFPQSRSQKCYRSAFTSRYLLSDEDGHYRFASTGK